MKYFILASIAFCLFFQSCKKSDNSSQNCRVTAIRTAITGQFNNTVSGPFYNNANLDYDGLGNLKSLTSSSDTGGVSDFIVKYTKDTVKIITKRYGDYIYILDAKNRIVKAKFGHAQSFEFTYNDEGQIGTATVSQFEKYSFTYANGNLVKVRNEPYAPGEQSLTYEFIYDLNEAAVDVIYDTNPISYIFPKPSLLPAASFFGITSRNRLKGVNVTAEALKYNYLDKNSYSLTYIKELDKLESLKVVAINTYITRSTDYNFAYTCD
ncbi:hypothetical protein SAMN05421827_10453 [Pedobacter terrae]|uniref:YD repeat-containing protein n=1 Tax=Pedobacter terrae TaxID=405671 RepID=A0A1G7S609_9SPHI|nr:hypothetical protein [Pedobacter terrae]SDG18392.1 hypothetical protein SAMN05421827_10453 [Pedobacter terrae]